MTNLNTPRESITFFRDTKLTWKTKSQLNFNVMFFAGLCYFLVRQHEQQCIKIFRKNEIMKIYDTI